MSENSNNPELVIPSKRETSPRLMLSTKAFLEPFVGNPNAIPVLGKEHLAEILQGKKVIIATTHLTDIDVPAAAYALGKDFDLMMIHHSTHDQFSQDAISWVGAAIAGRKNFLSVKSKKEENGVRGDFDPKDFIPMKEALDAGKTIVIAGHNPTYDWKLSGKGGMGAVYLAQISDAVILPVSVDIEAMSESGVGADMLSAAIKNRRRSKAQISIGRPITLDKINAQRLEEILKNRKEGESLSSEDKKEFSIVKSELRKQSEIVMSSLSSMLPPEKRGIWGENGR